MNAPMEHRADHAQDIEREAIQAEGKTEPLFYPHELDAPSPPAAPEAGKPKRKPVKKSADLPGYQRPMIRIVAGERHDSIDRAITALRADPDLYQREGVLVHIVHASTEDETAVAPVAAGSPKIYPMASETLGERLTKFARWEKYDKRSDDFVITEPTELIVRGIVARKMWKGIKRLVGVIETPTIRPDGSLLDVPGHDAATGFVYLPTIEFPEIPARPTLDDARVALATLLDVFVDFPYAIPAGRSMAVAAVLTILGRPGIKGATPAFLFDANTPGSGKTLQADVASYIATGRGAGRKNYPSDQRESDKELEKVLGSYALNGASVINFDNIDGDVMFGGSAIEGCLTAEDTYSFRLLGQTLMVTLPWRAVMFGSGNNIRVTNDGRRRVLKARIESPLENPGSRPRESFVHPERAYVLTSWVREHRANLVCAGLTLLRAYVCAGRPKQRPAPWGGGFEMWSSVVADAIVWAGGDDPMLCRADANDESSPERVAECVVVHSWKRLDPTGKGITAKSALDVLYSPERLKGRLPDGSPLPPDGFEELREAIEQLTPTKPGYQPDAVKLGKAFRKIKGSVRDGLKLDECGKTRTGVARWAVLPAGEAQQR
jgi:hypothetical protein